MKTNFKKTGTDQYKKYSEYHEVKNSKSPYVTTVLSKVNPDVKFKSTAVTTTKNKITTKTGHYRFWSTVGLMYSAAVKANNEAYDLVNSGELEYLSEGFFDAIKRAWNKFKTLSILCFTARRITTRTCHPRSN